MNQEPPHIYTGKHLAKKILAVMRDVGPVKKDKKNEFHHYQYASDEAIISAIRESLLKNNLCVSPSEKSCIEIVQKTKQGEEQTLTKLEMEYELTDADSGESKLIVFPGYGSDKADKGVYKAITGAEKYFFMKTFLIATPDDPEFEKTQREAKAAFANKSNTAPARPMPPPRKNQSRPPLAPSRPAPAPSGAPAKAPSATPPAAPARVSKYEQQTVIVFLKDVTKKNYGSGSSYFKINGEEGESWTTFSQTIAETAKGFAAEGRQVQLVLEMQPKGPVVQSIQPI